MEMDTAFYMFAVAFALIFAISAASAQMPMPVTVCGNVTYANGTRVPDGWNVTLINIDTGESWSTTTKEGSGIPPIYNYEIVGSAYDTQSFRVEAGDPTGTYYYGSKSFTASGFETKIVDITVYASPPAVPLLTLPATILLAILLSMLVILLIIRGKVKR